jgi:WD40 repeat protein
MYHKGAIEQYPLQTYASALLFSPKKSLIRNLFEQDEPDYITIVPGTRDDWSACLQTLEGHRDTITSVAFSCNSTQLASAAGDNTIRIWDASTGRCLRTLEGHSSRVSSAAFSPNSTRLVSASQDSTVKIWDVSSGACLQTLEGHSAKVESVAFSHDSTQIVSASEDKTIKIWDISSGGCLQKLEGHNSRVSDVAFSRDSTRLASASYDGTVKIWDPSSGACLRTLGGHSDSVEHVAFSYNSTQIASVSYDRVIRLWDVDNGICLQTLHVGKMIFDITSDATGFCLRTGTGTIIIDALSTSFKVSPATESEGRKCQFLGFGGKGAWITCNSENLIWLPSEYRPSCSAVSGNTIGIGVGSGRIWICKVQLDML